MQNALYFRMYLVRIQKIHKNLKYADVMKNMEINTCRKATSTYFMYEIGNNFTHLEGKKAKI